jgi:hypothetical protein
MAGVALHAVEPAAVNRHDCALHVDQVVLAQIASDPFTDNSDTDEGTEGTSLLFSTEESRTRRFVKGFPPFLVSSVVARSLYRQWPSTQNQPGPSCCQ